MSRADKCSSVPNFIANRSSLAKSEILRMFLGENEFTFMQS
jgi:hypothetical protein